MNIHGSIVIRKDLENKKKHVLNVLIFISLCYFRGLKIAQ